jgi:hypothetical protein
VLDEIVDPGVTIKVMGINGFGHTDHWTLLQLVTPFRYLSILTV